MVPLFTPGPSDALYPGHTNTHLLTSAWTLLPQPPPSFPPLLKSSSPGNAQLFPLCPHGSVPQGWAARELPGQGHVCGAVWDAASDIKNHNNPAGSQRGSVSSQRRLLPRALSAHGGNRSTASGSQAEQRGNKRQEEAEPRRGGEKRPPSIAEHRPCREREAGIQLLSLRVTHPDTEHKAPGFIRYSKGFAKSAWKQSECVSCF
ncbi:omega amino acid--pyruvate aminotransferase [Platysternon megacephalum]|uniref:Omega amino acid--pyruvate aminotransferase n=1 Tax=Platysternon megacephalum TaxID=55544 RepID=A0A4D9DH38_9SAUR|nr:omega amino acid--pyruvate aminotransferase [Platysternon megacephalum]